MNPRLSKVDLESVYGCPYPSRISQCEIADDLKPFGLAGFKKKYWKLSRKQRNDLLPHRVESWPWVCQNRAMDKSYVISKLREHQGELKAAGIVHLRVFGSVARGEASRDSDVDLLAEFDESRRLTLLTMSRLENRLGDLLGVKVDLSSAEWMREPVRRKALSEAVLAF